MPHDGTEHWHEPSDKFRRVGEGKFVRQPSFYDRYMEEQGVPVFRGFGISKVQDLPLLPWTKMGGRGSFIQLFGTEGLWGCYVIEVPARSALNVDRHMYEEQFIVVEGRGATEIWVPGGKKITFEWQQGSMFAIPLNTCHRIINSSSSPALLLAGTTAPNAMNLYANNDFIFNNEFCFKDRFNERADYFREDERILPDPVMGRAMRVTNFIPDIINCDLPLDNRRSPGYRRVEPYLAGNRFYQFIAQHETGRYSKGHAHAPCAVLICLKGKGYTYTWPTALGTMPFSDGKADQVVRIDYEPIGMVSAAPMSGDWYHQHFGVSKDPLRLTAWFGPNATHGGIINAIKAPGTQEVDEASNDLEDGGKSIPYFQEDPFIRSEFDETLSQVGLSSRMEPWLYEPPKDGDVRPSTAFLGKHK